MDCKSSFSLRNFSPVHPRKWRVTETKVDGDGEEIYGADYKHRKWCGLLTKEEIIEMIEKHGLDREVNRTMGSIGTVTPDGEVSIGWAPAVGFSNVDEVAYLSLYATPYVVRPPRDENEGKGDREWCPVRVNGMIDRDWERLEDAMIATLDRDGRRTGRRLGRLSKLRSARITRDESLPCRD